MNKTIQTILSKIESANRLIFNGNKVEFTTSSADGIKQKLENVLFSKNSTNDPDILVDEADLAHITQEAKLNAMFIEIDDWQDEQSLREKLSSAYSKIAFSDNIFCLIEGSYRLSLGEVYCVINQLESQISADANIVFGVNYFKEPSVRLKLLLLTGK